VKLYPMHTNTWFYLQIPDAATSSDIKTVSYRYATYRTTSVLEPYQDEAHGSCQGKPDPVAVANYVNGNYAGLADAVIAHRAVEKDSIRRSAGEAKDESIGIPAVSGLACLVIVGLLRMRMSRAADRALL